MTVPSGIATDYYNQDFFAELTTGGELVSLYDFENRRGIFPEVEANMRFSLLTLSGSTVQESEFSFGCHSIDDLEDSDRRFSLHPMEFTLINPNTRTCPTFRTKQDAELTREIYHVSPVLINESENRNPWRVSFLRTFDMTNDSDLFHTREELLAAGLALVGNRFVKEQELYLPFV